MARYYSRAKAKEYGEKMEEINDFCRDNGIDVSQRGDSYYFTLNGVKYRVSNHTIKSSDSGMFKKNHKGEVVKVRESYHYENDIINITAGKTRIEQVYNDLKAGYNLDKRGFRVGW